MLKSIHKSFWLIPLLLFLVSCTPLAYSQYTHPTKNAQDFERDKYECRLIAEQSAANWGAAGNPMIIADEMRKCLQIKYGWIPVESKSNKTSSEK